MIDFIGIGAQKSGTSWAYACLYEHPQICAPIKEIHFFSRSRFEKGQAWYEHHFRNCDATKLKGEFSTSYLYSEDAPLRIKQMYPKIKLITILRNPITRAVSHYKNAIKSGEISGTVSFDTFVQQEKSALEQGKYAQQLEGYYAHFQKDQILVLVYEDSKKDPEAFMQTIYAFLGIETTFVSSMLHTEINIARAPKAVFVDRIMHHVSESLRKVGFDSLVHTIRKSGLPDLVRSHNTKPEQTVNVDTKALQGYFEEDVTKLSTLLRRDMKTEWGIHHEA